MTELIARTKIAVPKRRSDLLTRGRLVELFTDLLGHRMILVVAPAGYGKTSALIDFVHTVPMPVCWVALDALDRDPYRFYSTLCASITQRFPHFGPAAQAAIQSLVAGQIGLPQFVTLLVNELYEHADDEYFIIIDDYHLASETDEINLFISQFVQQVDENCHLVLAARRLMALPDMPLLVARGYVSGLDFEDLAFTEGELQQLILQQYGQSLSASEAADLVKATEGWITGLLLSAQSRLRNLPERVRRLRAAGVDLYDYLAQQVFDQQPDHLRSFLLRTSVLDEFDAELCAAVLEPAWLDGALTWHNLIDEVLDRNLFAVALDEGDGWVRYHHLFQEFLERQFARERPEEETSIAHRLAAHYVGQQEWEKAYRASQKIGDLSAIAELLIQAGTDLFQRDRIVLLDSWLAALPVALVAQRPTLLSLQGAVRARNGHFQEGLVLLDEALGQLRTVGDSLDLGYALVRRAVVQRVLGNETQALADGEQALALVARLDGREQGRVLHAQALKTVGITLDELGQSSESLDCLQGALVLYRTLGARQDEAAVLQELARIHMSAGNYGQALTLFEQALAMLRSLANLTGQAVALNNLGVLYHLQGDILRAIDAFEEAHACAERSGYPRFMVYSLASLGDVLADLDLWEAAAKVYRQALQGANNVGEKYLTLYLELALAQVATRLGNWEQAFTRLDTAAAILAGRTSGEGWMRYQLSIGQYYLGCGRAADALAPLRAAAARFGSGGQLIEQAIAGLYLAAAQHATGDAAGGQATLAETLDVTQRMETQRPLTSTVRTLKPALHALAADLTERRPLDLLLGEATRVERELPMLARSVRQQGSPMLQGWLSEAPPQLLIRTLGRAEVVINGRVVTDRDWQTQSAHDLFFCLLAHPEGLTREQVGAIFWPDASPSDVKTRFKNSIYRLRSALNEDVVRFDDDHYTFNRAYDYDYDVESLKSKLAYGNASTDLSARSAAFAAALQLYRGEYLSDVDGEWARLERTHLNRLFLETALSLAEVQLAANQYALALATCERALAVDSCLEAAHRLAMQIYAAMGSSAGVVRQYRLCQQALLSELDVPPSSKTTELYELLTRQRV